MTFDEWFEKNSCPETPITIHNLRLEKLIAKEAWFAAIANSHTPCENLHLEIDKSENE